MLSCEHGAELRGLDGLCVICGSESGNPVFPQTFPESAPAPTADEIPTDWRAELMRRDLAEFVRGAHASRSSKSLLWSPHLDGFCETVQAMAEEWLLLHGCFTDPTHALEVRARVEHAWELHGLRKQDHEHELLVQNITINAPPGSLKSEIVMVYLPAWAWLHCPWLKFGCASAILKNVTRDSDAMHDLVAGEWYRSTFGRAWIVGDAEWEDNVSHEWRDAEAGEIRVDIDAKGKWANTSGGERQSVTMYQGFTGQHVHWILCVARGTKVATEIGDVAIEDLGTMDPRPRAWTLDEHGVPQLRHITKWQHNGRKRTVRVYTSTGHALRCTDDHRIRTVDGYIEAKDVTGCTVPVMYWADRTATGTSYPNEQRAEQLADTVRSVSHTSPQVEAAIAWVDDGGPAGRCDAEVDVYDISVEHDHCFFADGVLVHNCDDPDDPDRVWSDSSREGTRDRWSRVFENRVDEEATALRFIVQQQVHPADLSNHVRSLSLWAPENRMGWAWLCIPLIKGREPKSYPGVTPYGWRDKRATNDNMQPERYPERVLADKRRKLGAHGFEAQYNQNATPTDGGWFKLANWRFFSLGDRPVVDPKRPKGCTTEAAIGIDRDRITKRYPFSRVVLSVDASMGTDNQRTSSACGLTVQGLMKGAKYWLDDRTDVMDDDKLLAAIRSIIAAWPLTDMLVEMKALGHSLVTRIERELREGVMGTDGKLHRLLGPDGKPARIRVVRYVPPPRDSKISRARAALPDHEARMWYVLEGAPWQEKALDEISRFPNGDRDDRIDCWSQLCAQFEGTDVMDEWRALAGQSTG